MRRLVRDNVWHSDKAMYCTRMMPAA